MLAHSSASLVTVAHEVLAKLLHDIGSLLGSGRFLVHGNNNGCKRGKCQNCLTVCSFQLLVTFLGLHAVETALVLLGTQDSIGAGEEDEPRPSQSDAIGLEVLG